ncbi:MAG TPA: 30S ribosomal protein S17 [Acidobacteriota bacterium]
MAEEIVEQPEEAKRRLKKALEGVVISNRMQKSVIVRVERQVRHPLYEKIIRKSSKFMAHDEENKCRVGDRVMIIETRPLSKRKRWKVVSVLNAAQQ